MASTAKPPTLGQQLHAWRISKDLTLREVGELLGRSHSAVQKIEQGLVEPNDRTRRRIEKLLKARRAA